MKFSDNDLRIINNEEEVMGLIIKVSKTEGHDLEPPQRESEDAAGLDLRAEVDGSVILAPGEQAKIPTGYRWAIPRGFVGLIRDRSGHAAKRRLTTRAGVIDCDYRGEVMVLLVNESDEDQAIDYGDRIAQMVVVPFLDAVTVEASSLDDTERGEGGFGHTGKR